ncbi:hypothetical protein ACH5RR_008516 [Cinchona calisaya]|uniref:DRBM domain-containing protein n=1 Tax=Cinchona calisaya TaxID=153742 RepID=A0ABD3ABZ2_9GENT
MLDKTKFTSKLTFPDRKAAEQDAAKMAYESTVKDSKSQLKCPHIYQNPIYCKLILHEYAIKTGLGIPKYKTTLAEGPSPLFVSTFVLGGKTYTGEVGRSKKVAEQLVARVAIQSLLGSDSGKLTEIIKSKDKLFTCKDAKKNSGDQGITALSIQKPGSGQFARQQASIQTGILSYNRGNCRVTYPKTKRKVEINKWEENKKKSHGVVANKRL